MDHIKNRINNSGYLLLPQSEHKVQKISQSVKIAQLLGSPEQSQTGLKNLAIKISQPERITPYRKNMSTQKKNDSAIKISRPERITPYWKNMSTQKKYDSAIKISQPERITPYLKNMSIEKKNGTNIVNRLHHSEKKVRRNLKFTETPTAAKKTKKVAKASTSNLCDNQVANEERLHSSNRKSLLLPPNTIKDMHIRNISKQSKSMSSELRQTRVLTAYSGNKYPRISEASENCSPLVKNTNAPIEYPVVHEKNNKTSVIQHTSSRMFHANDQSGINSLHSSHSDLTDANNDTNNYTGKKTLKYLSSDEVSDINIHSSQNSDDNVEKSQLSSTYNVDTKVDNELHNGSYLNLEANAVCILPGAEKIKNELCSIKDGETSLKEKCLSTTTSCGENLYVSLQTIKTMSESSMNLQDGVNENNKYVTLNKKEFTVLASKLKHLICKLEEDASYLKLMLTFVMNVLSADATNKITSSNENKNKQQIIKHLNNNTEVVNSTNTKSSYITNMDSIDIEGDNTPKETRKTLNFDISNLLEIDVPRMFMFEAAEDNFEVQPPRQIDLVPEGNKENKENPNSSISVKRLESKSGTRRRSARLMAKAIKNSSIGNDSFVNLENELNITNVKSDETIVLHKNCTPVTNKCKDKKAGRPWKEYMALKSRMSCLLTPNIKRFNSSMMESHTQHETEGGASLSNKIFAELNNLYADSPDA